MCIEKTPKKCTGTYLTLCSRHISEITLIRHIHRLENQTTKKSLVTRKSESKEDGQKSFAQKILLSSLNDGYYQR